MVLGQAYDWSVTHGVLRLKRITNQTYSPFLCVLTSIASVASHVQLHRAAPNSSPQVRCLKGELVISVRSNRRWVQL
jgi:hypothetical protein